MDANTKYKRWGWGAVIGLVAVILIAGLVIAVSMSSPKKADTVLADDTDNSAIVDDNNSSDGNNDGSDNSSDEGRKDADEAEDGKNGNGNSNGTDNGAKDGWDGVSDNSTNNGSGAMPKTGPEDNMLSIVALAVISGLTAYNLGFLKKNA